MTSDLPAGYDQLTPDEKQRYGAASTRYTKAAHAMQSGVAFEHSNGAHDGTPKLIPANLAFHGIGQGLDVVSEAVLLLTGLDMGWEYSGATKGFTCDCCRAVEACHAAGGHVWGSWRRPVDGSRWRECVRRFAFGPCPGYQTRGIETAHVKEGVL